MFSLNLSRQIFADYFRHKIHPHISLCRFTPHVIVFLFRLAKKLDTRVWSNLGPFFFCVPLIDPLIAVSRRLEMVPYFSIMKVSFPECTDTQDLLQYKLLQWDHWMYVWF